MESVTIGSVIAGLALAMTFGGMSFFAGVMAPLIFTKLPPETAGAFIRQVFPWYYLSMGTASLIALGALAAVRPLQLWVLVMTGLVFLAFIYTRQSLMPKIKGAQDAELQGDQEAGKRFASLHRSAWS